MEKIVIAALLGWAGGYRFYKKQYSIGVLYLFTVGLFGIGWILDIISAVREYLSANTVPDAIVSPAPSDIAQSDADSPIFYIHSSKATEKNLQQLSQRFIAFDTETTGIDADNDRIISIAAILYENGVETDSFYTLVNPGRHIPEDATRINGITDDMAKQGISEAEMCNKFLSFIGDAANSKIEVVGEKRSIRAHPRAVLTKDTLKIRFGSNLSASGPRRIEPRDIPTYIIDMAYPDITLFSGWV